jgi:hypothetical protein
MKRQIFADIPAVQRKVITLLRGIPENDFQDCFRLRQHRLRECVPSQGKHFVTASAQVSKFCSHRAINGIKLPHYVYYK